MCRSFTKKTPMRNPVKAVVRTYYKTKLGVALFAYAVKIALELKKGK